jgi:small subunit ribosomal protein S21e
MQNDKGEVVDLYVPRKCSATNRVIAANDHASVQINVGHIDQNGVYTGEFTPIALSGYIRQKGESDYAVVRLCEKEGLIRAFDSFAPEHKFRFKK